MGCVLRPVGPTCCEAGLKPGEPDGGPKDGVAPPENPGGPAHGQSKGWMYYQESISRAHTTVPQHLALFPQPGSRSPNDEGSNAAESEHQALYVDAE